MSISLTFARIFRPRPRFGCGWLRLRRAAFFAVKFPFAYFVVNPPSISQLGIAHALMRQMEFDHKTFDYKKYFENEVWKTFPIRPRPEPDREGKKLFICLAFAVFITAGAIIGYLTNLFGPALVLAFVAAFSSFAIAFPLRCPKCHGRVITRRVDDEDDPENYYYWYNDCPNCEISWQSKRQDQSSS